MVDVWRGDFRGRHDRGIGRVEGTEVMVVVNDATVKGGTYYPLTVKSICGRRRSRCKTICLASTSSTAAAPIAQPGRGVSRPRAFRPHLLQPGQHVCRRHPADRLRMGSMHGGRRLCAGDVGRDDHGAQPGDIFSAAAAGEIGHRPEDVSAEDLGGADVHTRLSGVADHYALDDEHALAICRRIVRNLNRNKTVSLNLRKAIPPLHPADELYGSYRRIWRQPYDVREVIARIADGSEFDDFKQNYGTTLITGFAHLHGMPVGIIANNGVLFSESALKGAHFIELCCQRKIPLVFLQNITGFMVGRNYEAAASPRTAPSW